MVESPAADSPPSSTSDKESNISNYEAGESSHTQTQSSLSEIIETTPQCQIGQRRRGNLFVCTLNYFTNVHCIAERQLPYKRALSSLTQEWQKFSQETQHQLMEQQQAFFAREAAKQREWEVEILERERASNEQMLSGLMNSFFQNLSNIMARSQPCNSPYFSFSPQPPLATQLFNLPQSHGQTSTAASLPTPDIPTTHSENNK